LSADLDRFLVVRLDDGQHATRAEDLRKQGRRIGAHMNDDQHRRSEIHRQRMQQHVQWVDAAGRRADHHRIDSAPAGRCADSTRRFGQRD
jgi:hypothetical protein